MATQINSLVDNKRKIWIDDVRGLAMICVVISHCGIPNVFQSVFAYFFVPVFFFVSGYLHTPQNQSWKKLQERIFLRLGLPYIVFTVFHYMVLYLAKHDVTYLLDMILRIPIGKGLWFFSALMSVDFMVFILAKIQNHLKSDIVPDFAIFISLVAMYIVNKNETICWNLDVACCCIGFFYGGVQFRKHETRLEISRLASIIIFVVYIIVSSWVYRNGLDQNISINIYTCPIVNYSLSMLGSLIICVFCKNYSLGFIVNYIGKNTIVIFGTNVVLILITKNLIGVAIPDEILNRFSVFYVAFVVGVALSVACVISFPINKYCPIIVGNKKT